MRSAEGDYFQWLCDIITNDRTNNSYLLLLKDLHSFEFSWSIDNDDNRAKDALELRQEYCGYIDDRTTVSILEVLITIAHHMDDMLYDSTYGERVDKWFWKLIKNLKLNVYDDDWYNSVKINDILHVFINRLYTFNGDGGLFPLIRAEKDQRTVEIWYQMSVYLVDNYEF